MERSWDERWADDLELDWDAIEEIANGHGSSTEVLLARAVLSLKDDTDELRESHPGWGDE